MQLIPAIDIMDGSAVRLSQGLYDSKKVYASDPWEIAKQFEAAGMKPVGTNPDTNLVEVVEIPSHPYFVGVQFHPEYKSTVANPHPLFVAFVKAALKYKNEKCK